MVAGIGAGVVVHVEGEVVAAVRDVVVDQGAGVVVVALVLWPTTKAPSANSDADHST